MARPRGRSSHAGRVRRTLWEGIGPLLVVSALCVVAALRRRSRADLVLLSFVAAYWVELMPIEAHFDRYVLPLIAVLAVLAGSVRALVPVAAVALVVPLVWSIGDAAALARARHAAGGSELDRGPRASRRSRSPPTRRSRRCPASRYSVSSSPGRAAHSTPTATSQRFVAIASAGLSRPGRSSIGSQRRPDLYGRELASIAISTERHGWYSRRMETTRGSPAPG